MDSKFSILIDENASLTKLFTPDVMKRLKIKGNPGPIVISNNPMLCPREVGHQRFFGSTMHSSGTVGSTFPSKK